MAGQVTQPMMGELTDRWSKAAERVETLWAELERARAEASSRSDDLDKWRMWLNDLLAELRSSRPVGGLPETALAQLDEFRVTQADVEQRRPELEKMVARIEQQLLEGAQPEQQWLEAQLQRLRADWEAAQAKLAEREKRLRDALEEALELAHGMQEVQDWLQGAEEHLAMVPPMSKLVEPLTQRAAEQRAFDADVQEQSERMKELNNRGIRVQLNCEKKDAIPLKNRLISLKHRVDKLHQRSGERSKALATALEEAQLFFGNRDNLLRWMADQRAWLKEREAERGGTGERIRELLDEHRTFAAGIRRKADTFEGTRQLGKALEEHAPSAEKRSFLKKLD